MVYYFYELGPPAASPRAGCPRRSRPSRSRPSTRGYNLYQANCARCHGVNGEGGIGPMLNNQEKLYQHLNPSYINTILTVGGRFVCGNPDSLMPVWSNEGTPPGPLNYIQIEDLIEFIARPEHADLERPRPELFEPEIDRATGKVETFTGWGDPNYAGPGRDAVPGLLGRRVRLRGPERRCVRLAAASAGASPAPQPVRRRPPVGTVVDSATNFAFDPTTLEAPADKAFQIALRQQRHRRPPQRRHPDGSTDRQGRSSRARPSTVRTQPDLRRPGASQPAPTVHAARSTRT